MSGSQQLLLAAVQQAVATDPNFEYTTLLLPGNGTNGAQNNTFLDSSTNAFSITRNGNTTQGTFSPFSQTGWGNYFNFATPDALRPSATTISNFGTGAFTIEFWVNFQSTSAAGFYYGGASGSVYIDYFSGSLRLGISGGSVPISYAFTPAVGTWYHVAFVRSSTTDTLYVNGTSVATGSDSQNYPSDSSPYVGSWSGATYTGAAYMSNLRIVKGSAVYTANFTPSTTPLTAISGTSLLTCQSNRFVDNSSNAFAITRNGNVSVQAFSPFNPTAAWSAATNGGSGYFDGSGDGIYTASNSAFNFGTGDFTLEAWVNKQGNGASSDAVGNVVAYVGNGSSNSAWISVDNSGNVRGKIAYNSGTGVWALEISGTTALGNGSWNHVAITRSGSTVRLFVNGAQEASGSNSTDLSTYGTNSSVGYQYNGSRNFNGYVSSARIVKGTAVYTAAFTVPTSPLTAISGTSLLCNFTNAGIYDATSKNDLETAGNAQISTTQSKFGGSSMYFDGTGDYLKIPSQSITQLGSGDWTIECWLYASSLSASVVIFEQRNTTTQVAPILYIGGVSNNEIKFYVNGADRIVSSTISAATWYHVALAKYNGNTKLFINGSQSGSTYVDANNYVNNPIYIGSKFDGTSGFPGYINDLRITKGIARYTSNFTPPTTAFLTL